MVEKVEVKLSSTTGTDWNKLAKQYTGKSEQPSTAAVTALLDLVNTRLPFSRATSILDNGCGPGVIMSAIIKTHGPQISESCQLLCADFSDAMIDEVKKTKAARISEGIALWDRVQTMVSNAMDMQAVTSDTQSHVLAGWVYFMTPDPQKCLTESKRVLKSGGVLGVSSWIGSEWLDVMGQVGVVVPERVLPSLPKEWTSTEAVKQELEKGGFSNIESVPAEVYMGYESHAELVKFLLYTMPHMVALTKGLSEEKMKEIEQAMIAKLKATNPAEPGRLKGQAIVAIGSKGTVRDNRPRA